MRNARRSVRSAALPVSMLGLMMASGGAVASDACLGPDATCWSCFAQSLDDCQYAFPDIEDGPLRDSCAFSAGEAYIACTTSDNNHAIFAAWSELFYALQQCEQQFISPEAVQACIDLVYQDFKEALEAAVNANPGNQSCDPEVINQGTGMFVHTLKDIADSPESNRAAPSYVTFEVGQTVVLPNAGVTNNHDASDIACAQGVFLMATYRTKLGTVTKIVDHDMDLSDGSPLSMYLDPTELVHADLVSLAAVFMDSQGVPVFFETGVVVLPDSHLQGDYNRDSVKDGMDLIEYLDGYTSDVRRADTNESGDVEVNDLGEFVDDYASGS